MPPGHYLAEKCVPSDGVASKQTVESIVTNRLDDSCGCAMGAMFMVAGLLVGAVYYGWQLYEKELTLLRSVLGVLVATFLAAGAGKIIGILRHRLKQKQFFPIRFLLPLFKKKGQ